MIVNLFVIALLGIATLVVLASSIKTFTEYDFLWGCFFSFLTICSVIILAFNIKKAKEEYTNAKPENQKQILLQNIENAQNEYEKFMSEHPELKEVSK